jgi:tRNA(Ile)-lysidine synthase
VIYQYNGIKLIYAFKKFLKDNLLLQAGEKLLLAVSGGLDSVVMAQLFYKLLWPFSMAHCNFSLRGNESDEDEKFVQLLADQYGVECYTQHFDTQSHARAHGTSLQMAARDLRYAWLEQLSAKKGYTKVALAHHANDALETLLFNITKGTGIAGLHGILPRRGIFIRPLLFATKEQLRAYAQEKDLAWREDSSNHADYYVRNLIRHHVIPPLQLINPKLATAAASTMQRIAQAESLLIETGQRLRKTYVEQQGDEVFFKMGETLGKPWAPALCWEWFKPFGFNFSQIEKLLQAKAQPGKVISSACYQLTTGSDGWLLTKKELTGKGDRTPHYIQQACTHIILQDDSVLSIHRQPAMGYQLLSDRAVAALDEDKLVFPLTIRPWQAGDTFFPLGMQQHKKVSDLLIDRKIPLWDKKNVKVALSEGHILWVIGHQIDDRFKVTASTQKVYELRLIEKASGNYMP